jgi:hypothetical protein
MPAEAMLVSAAIIAMFVLFGAVLYWGDRRTRDMSAPAESAKTKHRSF